MIQELFLSLLSGLSIFIGLDPDSVFFFLGKMDQSISSGIKAACWGGIINGLILLYVKYGKELIHKKFIAFIGIAAALSSLFCAPYFDNWVKDLRVFTWIFAGTLFCAYFFLSSGKVEQKLLLPALLILGFSTQIPGSTTLLILVLFLNSQNIPVKPAVLLGVLSLLPSAIVSFGVEVTGLFSKESVNVDWPSFTLSYLIACGAIFWSTVALMFIFKKSRQKLILNVGLGLGVTLLFLTSRYGSNLSGEKVLQFAFPSMGTSCEITLWTNKPEEAKELVSEAQKLVDSIEAKLSTYQPDSEINEMNALAFSQPFKCSDVLWENLKLAEYAYKISNGGFDVTIGPLVKLWAIKKKRSELPSQSEIDEALKLVGFDKIELNDEDKTVKFKVDGIKVDFGGLTKGWAVDQASKLLMNKGFGKFIVNLGGNLYCSPNPPEKKNSYTIGIKDPRKPDKLCTTADLKGQAVATSGNYEQFIIIDGKRYTHIIDPRTGYPVSGVDAVTVISASATLSDILSTAIFVEGEKSISQHHEKISNLHILFIDIKENGEDRILKDGLFLDAELKFH